MNRNEWMDWTKSEPSRAKGWGAWIWAVDNARGARARHGRDKRTVKDASRDT